MLKKLCFIVSALTLSVSITGYAQGKDPKILKEVDALKQKLGAGWIMEWNEEGTGLARIHKDYEIVQKRKGKITQLGSSSDMTGTSAKDIAINFLRNNARVFQRRSTRKRNASGAVYDDPRVAVGAGRVDGVGARAEA